MVSKELPENIVVSVIVMVNLSAGLTSTAQQG
jgi:hypothetical protein